MRIQHKSGMQSWCDYRRLIQDAVVRQQLLILGFESSGSWHVGV
jgi:hypothetical protein